ncbi:hypothetical protein D0X99_06935 [Algoriphagus lacus]|uniref:Uncharacterized protein n=1 Tax=Algoriphagus lacus TaxID=2056311 RepID=A0A418PVA9_9BACT|nr:hypothetical protein [Algoriphagus lacus]RIW17453.1 hypothetical protein D0X99_06935 [Algoriphagus lacus]
MKALPIPSDFRKIYKHWQTLQTVENQYSLKDWIGCISNCNVLIESMENDFFGYYYRGLCNIKLRFFEEALSDLEKSKINLMKNKFPKLMKEYNQDVELRIANLFRKERKYNLALKRIDLLLKEYPDYLNGYKEKAGIQTDMDNLQSALDSVNQGLLNSPKDQELLKFRKTLIYSLTTKQ